MNKKERKNIQQALKKQLATQENELIILAKVHGASAQLVRSCRTYLEVKQVHDIFQKQAQIDKEKELKDKELKAKALKDNE